MFDELVLMVASVVASATGNLVRLDPGSQKLVPMTMYEHSCNSTSRIHLLDEEKACVRER